MKEKMAIVTCLLLYILAGAFMIRQELKNEELEQRDAVILAEIADLKKKTRINAQDVDFLEKLVIEGKE